MQLIKIAAAALNQTPLDWQHNRRNIVLAIQEARAAGASVLCLPELCLTGYGCEDMFHAPHVSQKAYELLLSLLPETTGMVVSLGLPLSHKNKIYNTACLAVDGKPVGIVAKQFLANDGLHYEVRWFSPWPAGVKTTLEAAGSSIPLGDIHFSLNGLKVGFEICEDAWVSKRPAGTLSASGVDLIINPSASHFAFGKHELRKRLLLESSRAFGVAYVYANLLGNEAGRVIYDGDTLIAANGKLLSSGPRFSFKDRIITTAVLDLDDIRLARTRNTSIQSSPSESSNNCISVPFSHPEADLIKTEQHLAEWETAAYVKQEEFSRAVALGLFDYLRKSRSSGFVVSLSGGADSSAVACLVTLMIKLGVSELGRQAFFERLNLPEDSDPVRTLLCCVYQATLNNSSQTREAARTVAAALGAEFLEFDIDTLVEGYTGLISRAANINLNWHEHDMALQNIQARVRAPGVWLLANLKNALLLATSNRSEAAVGYATMDGDTCGGLSPIAGIDKAFLRQWLIWLEKQGPQDIGPVPALQAVNSLEPTAELRPQKEKQTDEGDLMPYEILDAIERAAIRDKKSPSEVLRLLHSDFAAFSGEDLRTWTVRFFQLWARNQWKRERYAPSFHLDDENLDPKTWCRFPILSGGFEEELKQLKA